MDAKKINEFYKELEKLATYNDEDISEADFANCLFEIKRDLKKYGRETPKIFELVRNKKDFRSNMQQYGGYQIRRDVLKANLYPIIEMYEQVIANEAKYGGNTSIREFNSYLKSNNLELKTKYGSIKILNLDSKSGGNGSVYFGKMSDEDVAIKVLINNTKGKINRFLCEYGNVVLKLGEKDGVVKMHFYDEIIVNNNIYPIICMKRYENKLQYNEDSTEDEIIDIVKQILNGVKNTHNVGIIHRDLKPDNILVSNGKIYIADFGIAYFNPKIYDKTGHTTETERLANYDFSAPEQRNSKKSPEKTMDIYAIGQLIQWLVFGETTRGTHRKNIFQKYDTPRFHFLDSIIDKCLSDDPKDRYQSVDEILNEIEEYNKGKKEIKIEVNTAKMQSSDTNQELKNALEDIMNRICYSYSEESENEKVNNFYILAPLSNIQIMEFLEGIPLKMEKLTFFDKVGFSKFVHEGTAFDQYQIGKENFIRLNQLYKEINGKNNYKLQESFIEYVKTRINENFELPF